MNKLSHCLIGVSVFLCLNSSVFGQETLEERLNRIEAKLDSLIALLEAQARPGSEYQVITDDDNLLWGIGSPTGTILDKEFFVINHNDRLRIPDWVAYYLSVNNLQGDVGRTNDFRPDPQLPDDSGSSLEDYRHSGFDRGHNAPAAAFKRSREAMSTTFLLSNMSPQTPNLNRQIWRILEGQVRDLVNTDGEAWVITGNLVMDQDSMAVCPVEFIGVNNVAVPNHCFKAILTRDEAGDFDMYAFLIPNQRDRIPGVPGDYLISVDRLESIVGYDFFPELDDSIEDNLESTIPGVWPK